MTTIAKIKTVAVAAALVAGIAGSAAAQGTNPFVDGQIPNHNTPNVNTPNKTDPNVGNPFAKQTPTTPRMNPFAAPHTNRPANPYGQHTNIDSRLTRFLVGTWQGRLNNGQGFRMKFLQDGRVLMARSGSQTVLAGRYRVYQGKIQFRILGSCSLQTRQCTRYNYPKTISIAFRPVNRQTVQVRQGFMRRIG